jgi:hypothetical protein
MGGTLAHQSLCTLSITVRRSAETGAFAWYKFSIMKDECPHSPWLETYLQFVEKTDPSKLKELLGPVEIATTDRLQQIERDAASVDGRLAIRWRPENLLEITVAKLSYPRWTQVRVEGVTHSLV